MKYEGSLEEFDYKLEELNSSNVSDDWVFEIGLNENLEGECKFEFSFISWQFNFAEPTKGWLDKENTDSSIIIAGLKAPLQTGYNVKDNNEDDESTPQYPDSNELKCAEKPENAEVTNINDISVHWTDVSNGNDAIKYQRRYSKVGAYELEDNHFDPIYTNHYTNYRKFSTSEGVDGVYGSQVRTWLDNNNDGVVQHNEVSKWSNKCYVEFDGTAPSSPTGLRRLRRKNHEIVYNCGDTIPIQGVHPDWDDNPQGEKVDHYEYTSFNAPDGRIGLNEKIINKSIFEYNGSWLPGEGIYGFVVRAVDKAGNKSAWAGEEINATKTLKDSCQIHYTQVDEQVEQINIENDSDNNEIEEVSEGVESG